MRFAGSALGDAMKKWWIALFSFVLILSFQNCQKANWNPESGSSGSDAGASEDFDKIAAVDFPILQMWDYAKGRTFDVDVATGHIGVYLEYGNQRDEDRCLTEAQRQELQALVADAEVCRPVNSPEQFLNRNCSQEYRAPYAVLVAGAENLRLGEKTNGCDVPTDLCGAKANVLQDFVRKTLAIVDQQKCP